MKIRTLGVIGLLTSGLLAAASAPAQAAFPGTNGRIVFSTDLARNSQIYSVRPNGSGVWQLTHFAGGQGATIPNVSPDGSRILFNHRDQIWVMDSDGSNQRRLAGGARILNVQPSWSPDGAKVAFTRCSFPFGSERCAIHVMDADGTHVTKLLGGDSISQTPEFSPDGDSIAFVSDRGGYVSNIWVMGSDGSNPHRLTDSFLQAWAPDWSPDGDQIVFTSDAELPFASVWVMRSDGTDVKELTHLSGGHEAVFARFSPDGNKIVLSSDLAQLDRWDLYVMNTDGSHLHAIVTGYPGVFAGDWGPAVTP